MYATENLTHDEALELMRADLADTERHAAYLRDLVAKATTELRKTEARSADLFVAIAMGES